MNDEKALRGKLVDNWVERALFQGWATGWAAPPTDWMLAKPKRRARRRFRLDRRYVFGALVVLVLLALAALIRALLNALRAWVADAIARYNSSAEARVAVMIAIFAGGFAFIAACKWLPGMLSMALMWWKASWALRRGDRTHGTARWFPLRREWWNPREAVAAALVLRPDIPEAGDGLVPWTEADATFVHFTWDQLSRHMLVVGATGSGKTTSFYHHLMISSRVPWIYQDQKGELPLQSRFLDRVVWGLDTRGRGTRSSVWNPMQEVKGPEDIEVMSALLFPDKGNMNDWVVREARMLFEAMCKRWEFGSLQEYVYMIENRPLDRIIAELPAGYSTALADARTRAYCVGEILDVLRPWINTARIADVTYGRSTVTIEDFIERGGYVLCNEDKHLRQPVTLFWGMLLHRLRNRSVDGAEPLLLLLDEFGDAGRIPNMPQALAMYRSKGVGMVAGVQSFALMETVYGETEWKAVRDGFGTYVVMTANITPQLQHELSEQLGTYTVEHGQGSVSVTAPQASMNMGSSAPSRVSSPLVPIDQWAHWSKARAAVVRGSTGPTWWIPWPADIVPTAPSDRLLAQAGDWRKREAERIQTLGAAVRDALPVGEEDPMDVAFADTALSHNDVLSRENRE